jgi:hypothetical protein
MSLLLCLRLPVVYFSENERVMEDVIVTSVEQIVKIGVAHPGRWYRGHSRKYGELTPGIFRKEWESLLARSSKFEMSMYEHFRLNAPNFSTDLPAQEDYLNWITLMQHHGLPTRLLDWTGQILIAAYFATSDSPTEDAEIWVLNPMELNKATLRAGDAFPRQDNKFIRYLSAECYYTNPDELVKKLGIKEKFNRPVALIPSMRFRRMAAQNGRFTIHPKPDDANTIVSLLGNDQRKLSKIIIPGASKKRIVRQLLMLGVSPSTIYPDLDGLCKEIRITALTEGSPEAVI